MAALGFQFMTLGSMFSILGDGVVRSQRNSADHYLASLN